MLLVSSINLKSKYQENGVFVLEVVLHHFSADVWGRGTEAIYSIMLGCSMGSTVFRHSS